MSVICFICIFFHERVKLASEKKPGGGIPRWLSALELVRKLTFRAGISAKANLP